MKINKEKLVLSVESELGSGGGAVAEALARALKVRCFAEEIIDEAAKLSWIPRKLLKRYEEKRVRHAYDLTADSEDEMRIAPEPYFFAAQIAACRELAEQGPCVLVDHHSNTALSDKEDHIGIFVHADREDRMRSFAFENGVDPDKVARRFIRADRERTRYFKTVAPQWGRASNYDLTVNASGKTPEVVAGHIVEYLETVTEESLVHPTLAQKRSA